MGKKRVRRAEAARNLPIDEQVERMRELLRLMGPETGSSALGAIRKAFPDAPLAARVAVLNEYRPQMPDAGSELSGSTGLSLTSA